MCFFLFVSVFVLPTIREKTSPTGSPIFGDPPAAPKVSLILATDMATHFDFLGKFRVTSLRELRGFVG